MYTLSFQKLVGAQKKIHGECQKYREKNRNMFNHVKAANEMLGCLSQYVFSVRTNKRMGETPPPHTHHQNSPARRPAHQPAYLPTYLHTYLPTFHVSSSLVHSLYLWS